MQKNTYIRISAVIFLIVGIAHIVRALAGWTMVIGPMDVPLSLSWIGVIVTFTLSYFGFKWSKGGAI